MARKNADYYKAYFGPLLIGRKIVDVRRLTEAEDDWGEQRGFVLVLDDGSKVTPLSDEEGNGPGSLRVEG